MNSIRVHGNTGVDQTDSQIKGDFPGLSFGPDSDLADINRPFLVLDQPPTPGEGERVVRGPNTLIEGVWTQTWVVEPIPVVPRTVWSPLGFMERFTEAEQLGIASAAM